MTIREVLEELYWKAYEHTHPSSEVNNTLSQIEAYYKPPSVEEIDKHIRDNFNWGAFFNDKVPKKVAQAVHKLILDKRGGEHESL